MNETEIRARLSRAAQRVADEDRVLFEVDINERSLTHRLAVYLEAEFPEWDVDCEYNRDRHDVKHIHLPVQKNVRTDDVEARTVFPDVIVHRRNTTQNLLVVEAKKVPFRRRKLDDRQKLRAYIEELGYRFGAFVVFDMRSKKVSHIEIFSRRSNSRSRQDS